MKLSSISHTACKLIWDMAVNLKVVYESGSNWITLSINTLTCWQFSWNSGHGFKWEIDFPHICLNHNMTIYAYTYTVSFNFTSPFHVHSKSAVGLLLHNNIHTCTPLLSINFFFLNLFLHQQSFKWGWRGWIVDNIQAHLTSSELKGRTCDDLDKAYQPPAVWPRLKESRLL